MNATHIEVPAPLLLDPDLAASAKLVWMHLQVVAGTWSPDQATIPCRTTPDTGRRSSSAFGPAASLAIPALPVGRLATRAALARGTVRRGLAQLKATGWLTGLPTSARRAPRVQVPTGLVLDRRLGIQERMLYGVLQLTPGYRQGEGRFTYRQLGALASVTINPVKDAIRSLQATGWLRLSQRHQLCPIQFTLLNPDAARQADAVAEIELRLQEADFEGEAIMREILSLVVDSDNFTDNARPGFLVNPATGQEMEFDRYYPPYVAFEFQGAQHFGATPRYSSEAKARNQQVRDLLKQAICLSRSITLVVLQWEDLSLEGIRRKVADLLPLRHLESQEQVAAYLESVAAAYRQKARRGRVRDLARQSGA